MRSSGHAESTDLTNDVNGGPSGIGIATAAGKAAFWDVMGAPESPKVIALEGEFALTEGHAQELKTQALALQVGKRLRVMISDNNAGIDDCLIGGKIGGVISSQFCEVYDLVGQWTSYGWNVFTLANGNDYGEVTAALKAMDEVDPHDRRPVVAIGKTIKGYWPAAAEGKIPGYNGDQLVSYASHPYALKMNSEYFVALAQTFEKHYGVEFEGIRKGPVTDNRERLIQFKTNIDVVMSLLDRNGLGDRLADRLVEIGDTVRDDVKLRISAAQRSVPRRSPARRSATGRAAEALDSQFDFRRGEASQHCAVQETGRGGRSAARDFRNYQVDELRHGRTILHGSR